MQAIGPSAFKEMKSVGEVMANVRCSIQVEFTQELYGPWMTVNEQKSGLSDVLWKCGGL